jgi:hypothetical protein
MPVLNGGRTYPTELAKYKFSYSPRTTPGVGQENNTGPMTIPPQFLGIVTKTNTVASSEIDVELVTYSHNAVRDNAFFRAAFPDLRVHETCHEATEWGNSDTITTANHKNQKIHAVDDEGIGIRVTIVSTSYVILSSTTTKPDILRNPLRPDPITIVPVDPPHDDQVQKTFVPGISNINSVTNATRSLNPAERIPAVVNPPFHEPAQTGSENTQLPPPPTPAPPGPFSIGTTVFSSGSTQITGFIIGSQTLFPGHSITLTSGSSTVAISLTTDSSQNTVLVVGSKTITLARRETPMMVVSPVLVTSVSTSIFATPGPKSWKRYTASTRTEAGPGHKGGGSGNSATATEMGKSPSRKLGVRLGWMLIVMTGVSGFNV